MKEIKFRAWIPELNVMIDEDFEGNSTIAEDEYQWFCDASGVGIELEELVNEVVGGDAEQYYSFRECKEALIMQYTGLKDKRGQPIYEGDIIEAFGDDWEVEWEPTAGCFLCINLGQEGEYSEGMDFAREYELLIIGNIYENKYLLGETK